MESKAQEQVRVAAVLDQIKARLQVVNHQLEVAHQETTRIEQSYGDATKVNVTEIDDRMETNAAVQQQKMMVARAVENETILTHEKARLQLLQKSPYFGRIDIDDHGEREALYIGMGTFINQQDQFMVYDWRAPIASVYYNGTLGQVSYQTPGGPNTVTLTNKRQFMIDEKGTITAMFDTDETVGDAFLQATLDEHSDLQMKNIVATIQQEQNAIIRDTTTKLLVVQGVAGSGKTSAVLQRVAYLLYHSRKALAATDMVMFSPNHLFANYIAAVLPSLGEKNLRQATMATFLAKRLSGLRVETLFERFERDGEHLPEVTQVMRRYKESPQALAALQAYVADHRYQPYFVDIMWQGEVFFSAKTISKVYASQPQSARAVDKFVATKNVLIKRLKQRIKMASGNDWVQTRLGELSDSQVRSLLAGRRFDSGDAESRFIAEQIAKEALAPVYDAIYNDYFVDPYQDYLRFLAQCQMPPVPKAAWQAMTASVASDLEHHRLRLEDAVPVLTLRDEITGGGQNHQIKYVFIDEMQDYSMAQLAYLHHAFPNAKLTLLGDSRQAVFGSTYQTSDFLTQVTQLFGADQTKVVSLNRSYRSTREITQFAKAFLPRADHIQAFNRAGRLPSVVVTPQPGAVAALRQVLTEQLATYPTVAVLTKDQASANWLFTRLQLSGPVTLLNANDHQLTEGCLIMPAYLAKGLEFDAVIGYDVSNATYQGKAAGDQLYTLATRALHQLTLIAIDELHPLLTQMPATLYSAVPSNQPQ